MVDDETILSPRLERRGSVLFDYASRPRSSTGVRGNHDRQLRFGLVGAAESSETPATGACMNTAGIFLP